MTLPIPLIFVIWGSIYFLLLNNFTQIYCVNTLLRKTEKEKAVDEYKYSIKISHEYNYITKELLVKVKILRKTQHVYNTINL